MMFGISIHNHKCPEYLGKLKSEWSLDLYNGQIYHNQSNKDKDKDEDDRDEGTAYGYYSQIGDVIECICD